MLRTELKVIFLIAITIVLTSWTPVQAKSRVGKTVKIKRIVIGSVGNRKLAPKQPVHKSERISAKTNSFGELRLLDNSRIVVGANSTISLDEFVVGKKKTLKTGTIKVSRGAFRFISGNSGKGSYTVKTPASTIGVMGTVFDVYVRGNTEYVLLLKGGVNVCSRGKCVRARRTCDIVETRRGKRPKLVGHFGGKSGKKHKSNFSLMWSQRQFSKKWRAPIANCAARAAARQTEKAGSVSRNQGNDRNTRSHSTTAPAEQAPAEPAPAAQAPAARAPAASAEPSTPDTGTTAPTSPGSSY